MLNIIVDILVSFKSTRNNSQLFEPQKNCSAERLNEAMLSEELHLVVHPAALGPHRQHHCLRFLSGHGVAEAETGTLVSGNQGMGSQEFLETLGGIYLGKMGSKYHDDIETHGI